MLSAFDSIANGIQGTISVGVNFLSDAAASAFSAVFGGLWGRDGAAEDDDPWLGLQTRGAGDAERLAQFFQASKKGRGRAVEKTIVVRLATAGDWEAVIKGVNKLSELASQTDKKGRLTGTAKAAKEELKSRQELAGKLRQYIRNLRTTYQGEEANYSQLKRRLDRLRDSLRNTTAQLADAANAVNIGNAWAAMNSQADTAKSQIESLNTQLREYERAAADAWNPALLAHYNKLIGETKAELWQVAAAAAGNNLAAQLQAQLDTTASFYNSIAVLRKQGLSNAALQQLINTGAEQGAKIAEALVNDKALADKFNNVFNDAAKFSKTLGETVANDAYFERVKEVTDAIGRLRRDVERWTAKRKVIDAKIRWTEFDLPKSADLPEWVTNPKMQVQQSVNVTVQGMVADPEGTARAIRKVLKDSATRNGKVEWAA